MTAPAFITPRQAFLTHRSPGASVPSLRRTPHIAGLTSSWPTSSTVVVGAYGEIDANNADMMTEYALGHAMSNRGLILDLSGVDFFGTEAFLAVHRVSVGCARARIAWSLVPGAAVSRLLRICDPQVSLPATETLDAALAAVQHQIAVHHGSSRAP
jgi:hypothetical protein